MYIVIRERGKAFKVLEPKAVDTRMSKRMPGPDQQDDATDDSLQFFFFLLWIQTCTHGLTVPCKEEQCMIPFNLVLKMKMFRSVE